jgi:hypothetical protein
MIVVGPTDLVDCRHQRRFAGESAGVDNPFDNHIGDRSAVVSGLTNQGDSR